MNNIKALFLSYMLLQMAFMMILPAIGPVIRTQGLQEWHAGLIVSLSGLFWMLSAKFWGQRSDELGRKKVLLPLTLGFFIFYLIWAVFIWLHTATPLKHFNHVIGDADFALYYCCFFLWDQSSDGGLYCRSL